jgi:hypothetical protein
MSEGEVRRTRWWVSHHLGFNKCLCTSQHKLDPKHSPSAAKRSNMLCVRRGGEALHGGEQGRGSSTFELGGKKADVCTFVGAHTHTGPKRRTQQLHSTIEARTHESATLLCRWEGVCMCATCLD